MASGHEGLPPGLIKNRRLDHWLDFSVEKQIRLRTGKVELGQGVLTALAQIAADELDVTMAQLCVVSGDTAESPDEGYTAASRSVEHGGGAIRLVCAEVRALFLAEAAARLNCAAAELAVAEGRVLRDGAETGLDYWGLAGAVNLARAVGGAAVVKPAEQLRLVGQDVPRLDLAEKLGGAPFIQDMPAELHGRLLHRPRLGAHLAEWDAAAVRRAGGGAISLLAEADIVAVLGEDEAQVSAAFEMLRQRSRWEGGVALRPEDAEAAAMAMLPAAPERVTGYGQRRREAPAHVAAASYSRPYIAHASIAPSCGLARWEDGRLVVWSHSQGVFALRRAIARALGLAVEAVTVTHRQSAGCYGHNGADDAAFDAAFLAMRHSGRTIRVLWTRHDELGVAPFGAAMLVRMEAGLDADFRPTAWQLEVWSPTHGSRPDMNGAVNLLAAAAMATPPAEPPPEDVADASGGGATRNALAPYDLPQQRVVHHFIPEPPVRTSALRSLGTFANVYATECFMDELAELAGADPVAYRLALMPDARARRVMQAAAEMAGWGRELAADVAQGFAYSRYKNVAAYVAVVVELSVDEEIRLRRVWCAADAGLVVNPDGARNQIEGGIIQSASWTLKEQVRFGEGHVASDRWEHYPILRFSEVPEIEITLLSEPGAPSLGVGEVAQGPAAAAIGNAAARALGMRLRHLPLTRERMMQAMLA